MTILTPFTCRLCLPWPQPWLLPPLLRVGAPWRPATRRAAYKGGTGCKAGGGLGGSGLAECSRMKGGGMACARLRGGCWHVHDTTCAQRASSKCEAGGEVIGKDVLG